MIRLQKAQPLLLLLLLLSCMCTVVAAGPICGCEHRYSVLMDLFNATNGARWRNNSGWGTLAPCTTDWKGVTCTSMNVSSDSSSSFWYDVTAIDLGNNKLSGTLPRSLVNLTNLVILSLGVNSITGSLPIEWSEFSHLVELYLHSNTLSGTLPDAWGLESSATGGGNLSTTLKKLYLSSNSLSGSIPASWGSSLLVTLQYFFAQTNYLSGTIPESLTGAGMNMLQIYLSSNLLSGNLPSSWKNMAQVTSIGVAGNRLNGTLPSSWGLGMKQLESLALSTGSISGTLPAEWGEMVSLTSLYLDANSMTGSLPASWGGMTSLALLYLHYNQLTGSLPMEWGTLQNLTVASLNGNAFTGGLPSSWGNMISLNTLYLYSNNLTGSLPPSWSQMPSLSSLSMYSNSLRGTIPAEWGQLKKIHSIYLNMNCLYGAIPGNFSTLPLNPGGLRLCNTNVTGGGGSKLASCAGVDNPSVWPAYCSIVPQLHHTKTQTVSPPSQTSSYTSSSTRSSTRSMTTSQQHRFTLTPTVPVDSTESLPDNATTSWSPSQSYVTCAALLTTSILRDSVALSPVTSQLPTQGNIGAAEVAVLTQQQRQIITSEILISANPLGRSLLVRAPWIAMNMTLGLFPWNAMSRFSVANVTLADSRRSTTTVLPLVWLVEEQHHHPPVAAADADKSTVGLAWFVIFAAPPSGSGGGWLGVDTPVMTDRTLQLRVTLTCDGAPAVTVAVNIPAPGSLPSLAGEVKAAVGYSQIVSVIAGGASSGSSLGRVMATRSMVMCDADAAVGGGVVDLGLKICDDGDGWDSDNNNISSSNSGPEANVAARSAIVSNVVLIGIVSAVLLTLSAVWCAAMPGGGGPRRSFLRATAIFVLPSSLLPVWIAILPSTSAAATLLISRLSTTSSCVATDAALAALGIVVSLSPSAALVLLWSTSTDPSAPWTCVESSYQQKGAGMPQSRWRRLTGRLLKRRWKWAEAQRNDRSNSIGSSSTTSAAALAQAWVVLLEYRVLWYAALDATLLVMVSSVAVIGGLDTTNTMLCQGATGAVVALLVGQLVLLLGLRPHTTLFSFVQSSTTLLLTGTGVVTQLLFVVISSTSTSGVWLAQVSAGCNLAVVGVSAVQMLIDMMSLLVAAKRRILTLSYRRSLEGQHRIESSSAAEMMLSVHTSSDFHQHPLQELYDEASSRSASNGHRSQVGRLSPTDLAVFREASPHHGGGGGRAVSWEGSFRGGGDSMRLKNMSMDSSSFLHHAEKKFWDRKGAAVSNGSFLFDAAVLGGRAVFVQQTSSPSPPGGASTTTTSAREHVGEDASRPSSSSQSIASPPSSPTTQIRTSGAPPTSSNQQQHPQGTPAASVVITSSSLQRGTAASTQQTKEAAAAAAIRSKATAATFTSSSSSEDDDEDL